jgi:type I restriction enzyme M protein
MLDQETKRRIDTARNILVGKVPDPKAQVEQITTALIYKFMDDMDRENEEVGLKPQFFVGDYAKYSWKKLFDNKLQGEEKLDLYVQAISSMTKNPNIPQLFRDIFKDAFLPFRDPRTLLLFLKEINEFNYDNSENLGNAFEYLLSVLGSQGDAGQFRTPRHIIDFIIEVVDPKKTETILDPACGTAGFLISAYKHILKKNSSNFEPEKEKTEDKIVQGESAAETVIQEKEAYSGDLLNPEDRKRITKNIVGYDISPDMVKLALVNLYLHGFSDPKIFEYDSLSSDKRWDENFDVILANPPFMTPTGGISPHKRFSVQANRAEVLFVDYIAEHLSIKGRAGIIVPEGIIFQSANSYKSLRKNLIENWGLYAVVSLPSGVFQPYSGVKTSILLMDREFAKRSKEILFLKVENDGFDLGAKRRKINKNDLPTALEVLEKWKTSFVIPAEAGIQGDSVKKEKIAENEDYNLKGDCYREVVDYSNAKWDMVELGEVCEVGDGNHSSNYPKANEMVGEGVPFIRGVNLIDGTVSNENIKYITKEKHEKLKKGHLKENDVLFTNRGEIGKTAIIPKEFHGANLNSQIAWLRSKSLELNPKYLFNILNSKIIQDSISSEGATLKQFTIKSLKTLQIPLPPLEVQEQIVAEIGQYQKVINANKELIDKMEKKIETKIGEVWGEEI